VKQFAIAIFGLAALLIASGCEVGPAYHRAAVDVPAQWSVQPQAPFQAASPADSLPKGEWWSIFSTPELNDLEQQAAKANQTLAAAQARLNQARAFARVQSAYLFPSSNVNPSVERQRVSADRPTLGSPIAPKTDTEYTYTIPFNINYEVDLFGQNRRNLESANAQLQASAADLENVRLIMTSELAADYFSLRELDTEIAVVQQALEFQQKDYDLVVRREKGGVASGLDVSQQATVLDATRAQLDLLREQRHQYEHAIAVLVGQPAPTFHLSAHPLDTPPPAIPTGVPSEILQRRPDVATAERQMASANAQVGVAKAAFYPMVSLFGNGGVLSNDITDLVSAPSAIWALGGQLVQPLFNGGRNRANLASAKANYDQTIANYRQDVLVAFQQVEDALTNLNALQASAASQERAVADAQTALTIANNRYVGGITTYLDVVTAEETLLSNQRLATQIRGQQMVNTVYLAKALGGGWDANSLKGIEVRPQPGQIIQP
jgi:NodT family efflux transporter outer membrane factor (OMF) lipoprotein